MTCRTYKILENNGDNYSNISKIVSWQLTWEGITRKLDEISMCQESWTDTGKQIGAIQQDHFPSRHSRSPRNDSVNCKFAQHDLILQAACYMDLIMVKANSILLWVLDMLEFYESSGLRSSSCSRREWANSRGRTLVARSTSLAAQSRSWPVEYKPYHVPFPLSWSGKAFLKIHPQGKRPANQLNYNDLVQTSDFLHMWIPSPSFLASTSGREKLWHEMMSSSQWQIFPKDAGLRPWECACALWVSSTLNTK